jgi:hypothetical protein
MIAATNAKLAKAALTISPPSIPFGTPLGTTSYGENRKCPDSSFCAMRRPCLREPYHVRREAEILLNAKLLQFFTNSEQKFTERLQHVDAVALKTAISLQNTARSTAGMPMARMSQL